MWFKLEGKVIYSKRFPHKSVDELLNEAGLSDFDFPTEPPEPFSSLINRIDEESTYILDEEKQNCRKKFIDLAIELSSDYEIDMEITDHFYYVTATMYLDCASCAGELKAMFTELVSMCDRINSYISKKECCDFVISLDYYTHDHFVSGRKVGY